MKPNISIKGILAIEIILGVVRKAYHTGRYETFIPRNGICQYILGERIQERCRERYRFLKNSFVQDRLIYREMEKTQKIGPHKWSGGYCKWSNRAVIQDYSDSNAIKVLIFIPGIQGVISRLLSIPIIYFANYVGCLTRYAMPQSS